MGNPYYRIRNLTAYALAAVCLALPHVATASEEPLLPQVWRTFTTRNGLPDNRIRTVQFIDDAVWVGTRGGLARLEGDAFRSWTQADGLPHSDVTAIDVDPATEDIWIGTWGGGIARLTAGRFDVFSQINAGMAGNLVFDLLVHDGRIWAATNAGICSYNPIDNTWELFLERRMNQPQVAMTDLCANGDELWATAWHQGFWRFDPQRRVWTRVDALTATDAAMTEPAGVSATESALFVATQSDIARRLPGQEWQRQPIQLRTRDAFVHGVAGGAESTTWLATNAGLLALTDWDSRTWTVIRDAGDNVGSTVRVIRDGMPDESLTTGAMIPDNRVRCVAIREGDLWVGTVAGLAHGTHPVPLSKLEETGVTAGRTVERAVKATNAHAQQPAAYARHRSRAPAAIAIFGPRSKTVALPGSEPRKRVREGRADLLAVQLALEAVNAQGGYRSESPFDLVTTSVGYGRYGWGTPEDDFMAFASYANVMGIVGRVGPNDHIVGAVAFETELPFMNVVLDRGFQAPAIDNPWVFQCRGDEPRQHRQFLNHLIDVRGLKRIAIVRSAGAEPLRHLDWWRSHAIERGYRPVVDLTWPTDPANVDATLATLRDRKPDVILAWPDAAAAAAIVTALRDAGMDQVFVGGKPIVDTAFVQAAGDQPGEVLALYAAPRRADTPSLERFTERYGERNVIGGVRRKPDSRAYASRAATEHLLTAIDEAGADLDAVAKRLRTMSRSATGEAHFEKLHEPTTVIQAVLEDGRWAFRPVK